MDLTYKDFNVAGEKSFKFQIKHAIWSPNRDMVALSDSQGRIHLHRFLNMDLIWSLKPEDLGINDDDAFSKVDKAVCHCLCWRPDGEGYF